MQSASYVRQFSSGHMMAVTGGHLGHLVVDGKKLTASPVKGVASCFFR